MWVGTATFPGHPTLVSDVWFHRRQQWDTDIAEFMCDYVKINTEQDWKICHSIMAKTPLVSGRDFLDFVIVDKSKCGDAIAVNSCSVEWNQEYPQNKKRYRGFVHLSGVRLKLVKNESPKDKDNDSDQLSARTQMTYAVQVDLKGWLSSAIVDLAMSNSIVDTFTRLNKYLVAHQK